MNRFTSTQPMDPFKILIVDQDPAIRHIVSDTAESSGFASVAYATPGAAHVQETDETYALAFIDVEHTGARGVELARILRENDRVGTIVVMDQDNGRYSLEALKQGACDVLAKPFSQESLDTIIREYRTREQNRSRLPSDAGEMRSLLERMPVLVFELDSRLELRFINHSCKELLDLRSMKPCIRPIGF